MSICVSAGEPYTDSWAGEWKYLYTLEKDRPNDGNFSFEPKPAAGDFSQWELGAIRVSSSNHSDGALYVSRHSLTIREKIKLLQGFSNPRLC